MTFDPQKYESDTLQLVKQIIASWDETGLPIKAVVICEYMDGEGDRRLAWRSTEDVTPWDRIGMLHSALMMQQAEYEYGYGLDDPDG